MIWDTISASTWAAPLGWALLHFLWQGTLIAAAVAAALRVLRNGSASARYAACCAGLGLMIIAPAATFLLLSLGAPAGPAPAAFLPPEPPGPSALAAKLSGAVPHLPAAWLAGACLLLARTMLHWCNAQWLRRRGTGPAPDAPQRMLGELCEALRIRRPVRLLESSLARVPMLIGWLQPVILVPAGAITGLSPEQLRSILAHELAHVRRHDYLVNVVQAIVESLLFYHPGVWWLSDRLRVEREYCCDDVAVAVAGNALGFAQALSLLDALRQDVQPALASTGGTLMNRIRRVAGLPLLPSRRPVGWMAPLAVAAAVVLAASSVGMSRPVESERGTTARVRQHGPQRDIVAVLREMGAEEAEFIEVLRDAGLDDAELMIVLERIGLDEEVRRSFEHAARRHSGVGGRAKDIHRRVAEDLEAGRITEAEAQERMHAVMRRPQDAGVPTLEELHEGLRAGRDDTRQHIRARIQLEGRARDIHRRIAEDLEAGRITEAEAEVRLHESMRRPQDAGVPTLEELHEELHAGGDAARQPLRRRMQLEMESVRARIAEELAAGAITPEEAARRMERAGAEVRKRAGDHIEHLRHSRGGEIIESKMRAVREKIVREVEAGRMTREEAREHLDAVRAEIRREIRDEIRRFQRIPDAPPAEDP